jgi:hypothetical protein
MKPKNYSSAPQDYRQGAEEMRALIVSRLDEVIINPVACTIVELSRESRASWTPYSTSGKATAATLIPVKTVVTTVGS